MIAARVPPLAPIEVIPRICCSSKGDAAKL